MLLNISKVLIGMLPRFALQSDYDAQMARWAQLGADDPAAEPGVLSHLVAELQEARRRASAAMIAIAAFEASQQSILAILAGIGRQLQVAAHEPRSHVRGCAGTDRAQPTDQDARGAEGLSIEAIPQALDDVNTHLRCRIAQYAIQQL